jgi:hypothetical protein
MKRLEGNHRAGMGRFAHSPRFIEEFAQHTVSRAACWKHRGSHMLRNSNVGG